MLEHNSKGQLISKGLFDVIVLTKNSMKLSFKSDSVLASKKGRIKKIRHFNNLGLFNINI